MQRKILIAVAVLTCVFAATCLQADDAGIPAASDAVQKEVQDAGIAPRPCPDCSVIKPPTLTDCARAACPVDSSNPSYPVMEAQLEATYRAEAVDVNYKDRQPVLEEAIRPWFMKQWEEKKKELALLDQLIKDKQFKTAPTDQLVHNMLLVLQYQDKAELKPESVADGTTAHAEIDRDKTLAHLAGLPKKDQEWLLTALQGYVRMPAVQEATQVANGNVISFFRKQYPDLSLQDAVLKEITKMDADFASFKKTLSPGLFAQMESTYPKSLVLAMKAGKRIDEDSLKSLLSNSLNTRVIANLLNGSDQLKWLNGRDASDWSALAQSPQIMDRLKQTRQKVDKLLKEIETKHTDPDATCYVKYIMKRDALPTEAERDRARQSFNDVRGALKDHVLSKLSQHTAQVLQDGLKAVEVYLPETPDEFKDDFLENIKSDMKDIDRDLANLEGKGSRSDARLNASVDLYSLLGEDFSVDDFLAQDFNDVCSLDDLPSVTDAAEQGANAFSASWISVKNPKLGKAIMAHEMGHLIDYMIQFNGLKDDTAPSKESVEKYVGIETCLTNKHPEDPNPTQALIPIYSNEDFVTAQKAGKSISEKKYNVEDFADLVSALAIPDNNVGCGLLDISDPKAMDVVNADADDTHSSNFFRALHVYEIQHGALPEACNAALKTANMTRDFLSCFAGTTALAH